MYLYSLDEIPLLVERICLYHGEVQSPTFISPIYRPRASSDLKCNDMEDVGHIKGHKEKVRTVLISDIPTGTWYVHKIYQSTIILYVKDSTYCMQMHPIPKTRPYTSIPYQLTAR